MGLSAYGGSLWMKKVINPAPAIGAWARPRGISSTIFYEKWCWILEKALDKAIE